MAEAAVETANGRFFCHECNREVSPNLPKESHPTLDWRRLEFTCSQCDGGFIEQLAQGSDNSAEEDNLIDVDSDPAAQFADLWQRTFFRFPPPAEDGERRRSRSRRPRARINIRANQRPGERGEGANAATAAAIDVILQNLFGGLGSTVSRSEDGATTSGNLVFPFNFLRLHGSPGDYAWGTEGLDTIITQLLNQIDGTGPAPANAEEIANLPRIKTSQELVDARTDCAVCQEKLALGEEVRKLPCSHYFHFDCIAPWLKLHDSCPVCRLSLRNTQTRG